MYLLIENKGVAPVESFTLLGLSTTRNCDVAGTIGQFGSGTKHAINLLLRKGIPFYIYSGLTQLEFFLEEAVVDDGLGTTTTQKVKCRMKGDQNRTIDCGWCLEFGAMSWDETSMALREFVSNALDRTKREQGDFTTGLRIAEVEDKRAKSGTTRIFIDMPDNLYGDCSVRMFFQDLGKHFLHFSDDPSQVDKTFLEKTTDDVGPRIYREGVYIRTLDANVKSAFDYNLKASEIEIDECRNSSEYVIRATIARMVNKADPDTLVTLFNSMDGQDVYESDLDEYYLSYHEGDNQKSNWQTAWETVAGNAIVAAEASVQEIVDDFALEQGHKIKKLRSKTFAAVAGKMGVKTLTDAIGAHAANGKIEIDAEPEVMAAVDRFWCVCLRADLTQNRPYPKVKCFKSTSDTYSNGYYSWDADRIVIRRELSGKDLDHAVLEQIGRYICRGDMGCWAVELAVALAGGEQ